MKLRVLLDRILESCEGAGQHTAPTRHEPENNMRTTSTFILSAAFLSWPCAAQDTSSNATQPAEAGTVSAHSEGLHGYIGFGHEKLPADGGYTAGMGFYAAVWPLVDQPLAALPNRVAELVDSAGQFRQHGYAAGAGGHPGAPVEGARPHLEQRLPDRRRRSRLLGRQPLPLRPAQVQHERHAAVLRLRGWFTGLVILLRQRGAAGPSPRASRNSATGC